MEKAGSIVHEALKNICDRLVMKHPEAIGMAVIELDCGCINICGVSIRGEPVGTMKTVVKGPVCDRCLTSEERISDRIVAQKMIWPGAESELPERDIRLRVGQKVFGEDYVE